MNRFLALLLIVSGCSHAPAALPITGKPDAASPVVIVATATAFGKLHSAPVLPDTLGGKGEVPAPIDVPEIEAAPLPVEPAIPVLPRVVFFPKRGFIWSAHNCAPCRELARELKRLGVKAETRHDNPAFLRDFRPAFHWQAPDGTWQILYYHDFGNKFDPFLDEIDRIQRQHGAVEKPKRKASDKVAASGFGGTLPFAAPIKRVFASIREYQGEGKPFSAKWHRTGAGKFTLLKGGDWSERAICGQFGKLELSAPGWKLPADSAKLAYTIRDSGDVDFELAATLKGLVPPINASVAAKPVGIIDPGTLLTLFTTGWKLLHPVCDLTLGGNVSASGVLVGDVLTVDFRDMPGVRLEWLFTFNLDVRQAVITPEKVTLYFSGSRFIRSRTFAVN